MLKKSISLSLAGMLAIQLTACGTLFHAERKGQTPSDKIDPEVLILDCCGLLFGVIPGVVALVLDFNNKTIYYTKAEARKLQASVETMDRSKMIAIRTDDMSNEAIEKILSKELGRRVTLSGMQVVAAR